MKMQTAALAGALILASASMGTGAWGQGATDYSTVQIKTTPLGHNTYELEGTGGNITVAVGTDAVIMVDSEFAPLHDKIKAAIDKVSGGKPIKYLVNTHFHGDHVGGDAPFAKDGTIVVAHVNLAKRLADGSTNGLSGAKTPPATGGAIPSMTYSTPTIELKIDGRTAVVGHLPNAHTDGDSYVQFADANVIATTDIVSRGTRYPTIDYLNGGSINGIIAAVETYLTMGNADTKYVPGHGPLTSHDELQAYHDMMVGVRDAVAAEIKAGKTEEQAVDDQPLAKIGARLMTTQSLDDAMVKMAYRSLKGLPANPP
jgi:glyoxylase-like metal-dependent hydrolase (beta-lactamase superfamily II)